MTSKLRLAIVVSHPIQHFVHLYRALARRDDLAVRVVFCSRIGLKAYHDKEMNTLIQWAGDITSGYDHEFLTRNDPIDGGGLFSKGNPEIGAALAKFRPDAVMLYGYAHRTQVRALAWCRLRGIPVLMTGDGDNVQQRSSLRRFLRTLVLKIMMRQVAGFLTVGDQNEAMLGGLGVQREKMFRAPFPIDEAGYLDRRGRRAEERARIRAKHGIASDAFVFVFVGKLSARKRPQDLALALPRLGAGATLLYCGDGPDRAALEAALEGSGARAVLAGFVNVDELPAYYCAADALAHPSEHDPHPLVCSEAACLGLPMILSDKVGAVGPTDIARAGENALVYRCGDVEALAAAMRRLTDEPRLRDAMAAASLRIYEECNLSASVEGVMQGLRAVTARRGQTGTTP